MFPYYSTITREHIAGQTIRYTLRRWNDPSSRRWALISGILAFLSLVVWGALIVTKTNGPDDYITLVPLVAAISFMAACFLRMARLLYREHIEMDGDRLTLFRFSWPGESSVFYIPAADVAGISIQFYDPGDMKNEKEGNRRMEMHYRDLFGGERLPVIVTRYRNYWFFGFGSEEEKQELVELLRAELKRLGYCI